MFLQAVFLLATICRCDDSFNLDEEVRRIFASPLESTKEVIIRDLWKSERVQKQVRYQLQKLVDVDSTTPEGESTIQALKSYGKEICEALVLFIKGHYKKKEIIMMLNAEARKHPSKAFDLSQPFSHRWYNTLKISGVKFNVFPIRGVNFLLNKCKTGHVKIEDCRNISIEVYEALKSTLLEELTANNVDLDEIPCLSNLPNLEDLTLEENCFKALDADRYYDKESNTYAKMHHLSEIILSMVDSYTPLHLNTNLMEVFVCQHAEIECATKIKMYADWSQHGIHTTDFKLSDVKCLTSAARNMRIPLVKRNDPGLTSTDLTTLYKPRTRAWEPNITYEEACRRGYDVVG